MALLLDRITSRLPEIARVVARFPVATAALLALTLYLVLDLHLLPGWSVEARFLRIPSALLAIALWAVAAVLLAEMRGRPAGSGHGLGVLGAAVICFLSWLANAFELVPSLLVAALALSVPVLPFLGSGAANDVVWQLGSRLAVALLLSFLAAALFAGGLSLILETLRVLLGLAFTVRTHEKVWAVAICLIGPVYTLSLLPRMAALTGSRASGAGGPAAAAVAEAGAADGDLTMRAVAVLVRFVAVPLLLVYALVLHVAAVKVLIEGELPSGRIGWMVLSFGAACALTALAAWPSRDTGGALVRWFWRLWPWLLVVPLGLLWLALAARVGAYGWTGPRYLAALAGIWLASLVVTQGVLGVVRGGVDLRLVAGALAVLLALASIGPWGYSGWPVRAQVRDLAARLEAGGQLRQGRIAVEPGRTPPLPDTEKARVAETISWLSREGRLYALRPYFEGVEDDPFLAPGAEPGRRMDLALAERVRDRLDLRRVAAPRFVGFQAGAPGTVELPAATTLVGAFSLASTSSQSARADAPGPRAFVLALDHDSLTVADPQTGFGARFDIARLLQDRDITEPQTVGRQRPPHLVDRAAGELPARVLLTNLYAREDAGRMVVTSMTFWLLLGP